MTASPDKPVVLQPVHHLGQRGLLIVELEFIGQPTTMLLCPHCRVEREHFIAERDGAPRRYAICRECGQGSRICEGEAAEAPGAEAGAEAANADR